MTDAPIPTRWVAFEGESSPLASLCLCSLLAGKLSTETFDEPGLANHADVATSSA